MEKIYFEINEKLAETANKMNSMSNYRVGSKTEEYTTMCTEVYNIAEKVAEANPNEAADAERLAQRYAKQLAEWFNKDAEISARYPSVLVSGAGNFDVRKKQKQIDAWDKNHEKFNQIQELKEKIERLMYKKAVIKSDDENAIEKLEEKIEKLKEKQEKMKAANRAVRLKDVEKGNEKLEALGYSDEEIQKLRTPNAFERVGFEPYALTSNNANIKRLEGRLKQLKDEKSRAPEDWGNEFFEVKEDKEEMRIKLFFDGKPDEDVRSLLKHKGFRWSPKNQAWQRNLNENGRQATKSIIKALSEMNAD